MSGSLALTSAGKVVLLGGLFKSKKEKAPVVPKPDPVQRVESPEDVKKKTRRRAAGATGRQSQMFAGQLNRKADNELKQILG